MADVSAFTIDVLAHVRAHLLAELEPDDAGSIATKIPNPRPEYFVRLNIVSGAPLELSNGAGVFQHTADVSIQVYGPTGDDTWTYAGQVATAALTLTGATGIAVGTPRIISAPRWLPDESRPEPIDRVVFTVSVPYQHQS